MKTCLVKLMKIILWIISKEHRVKNVIEDDRKVFTHQVGVHFNSDYGMATHLIRTVPYPVWYVETTTKNMTCADKQRVFRECGDMRYVDELQVGDILATDNGTEAVTKVYGLNVDTHMYSLTVNDGVNDNSKYYTNGILSKNTTTAGAYLLWKAMFFPDTKILITANKYNAAIEIMDRVRYSYEECPDYIRAGILKYNEGTIKFDNGSTLVARATTADAGRGLSITILYCLDGKTRVTVMDAETLEEKDISLEDLHEELTDIESL